MNPKKPVTLKLKVQEKSAGMETKASNKKQVFMVAMPIQFLVFFPLPFLLQYSMRCCLADIHVIFMRFR